ncbi:hypothetical protein GEMRC1_013694 [Eukaryota sp. GEM-RC1]
MHTRTTAQQQVQRRPSVNDTRSESYLDRIPFSHCPGAPAPHTISSSNLNRPSAPSRDPHTQSETRANVADVHSVHNSSFGFKQPHKDYSQRLSEHFSVLCSENELQNYQCCLYFIIPSNIPVVLLSRVRTVS